VDESEKTSELFANVRDGIHTNFAGKYF